MLRSHLSFLPYNIFRCNLHKLKYTFFIFLGNNYVLAPWDQLFLNSISKVVVDVAKGENALINFVVFEPLHGFVEFVVLGLEIFEL